MASAKVSPTVPEGPRAPGGRCLCSTRVLSVSIADAAGRRLLREDQKVGVMTLFLNRVSPICSGVQKCFMTPKLFITAFNA